MKFYVVRHGQTHFNKVGRIQGWCDSPLTNLGIEQAKSLNATLKDVPFVKAYSSTSERTYDTACYALDGRDISIERLKGLKELNFGTLEGEKEVDVFDANTIKPSDMDYRKYGGESMDMLADRFVETLQTIASNHNEDDIILVVCHGGIIMSGLMRLFTEYMEEQFNNKNYPENCSIHILNYRNNEFILEKYNLTNY